jgi:hypothetical protein
MAKRTEVGELDCSPPLKQFTQVYKEFTMTVKGNNLSLLITNAEIKSVSITETNIRAEVALMIGSKELTSVNLYSYGAEDSPNYLPYTEEMKDIYERLIKLVQKKAIISLDRFQNSLTKGAQDGETSETTT